MAGLANWAFDACRAWCGIDEDTVWVACWVIAKGENAATASASAQEAKIAGKHEFVGGLGMSFFTFSASTLLDFKAVFLQNMIFEPGTDGR
jgi:hypothetical protein